MLSPLRCTISRPQTCSRSVLRQAAASRSIHFTRLARSDLAPEPSEEQQEQPAQPSNGAPTEAKGEEPNPEFYKDFMQTIGADFKKADAPKKWLGGRVPFPMNPSFKPPPPVSDTIRNALYREYMHDPVNNNVRVLSQRYHLSLKRVDAILRLKGLEDGWKQGKELQTGFHYGMEMLLGVSTPPTTEARIQARADAHDADILEQDENRDAARQRYQRLYWESVPEDGREPIVPLSLEKAKAAGKHFTARLESLKSDPKLMPRFKDTDTIKTPKEKVQNVEKPGHVTIKVIDVGGKFLDVNERLHRISRSERRARQKASRAAQDS